jgi:hypothetical protein
VPVVCPIHALTGLDCPGCGLLRGTGRLLEGDLAGALDHNLLLPLVLPLVAVALVGWAAALLGRPVPLPRPGPRVTAVALAVVVAFGVARNLPLDALAGLGADARG